MRSKTFLASNILASVYNIIFLWVLIGVTIIDVGGKNIINTFGGFFEEVFEVFSMNLAIKNYLYFLAISLLVHIGLFIIGCIISWIAYVIKNDTASTVAAVIYVIGTICSPICFIFGAIISTMAFWGAHNQRKLNKTKE